MPELPAHGDYLPEAVGLCPDPSHTREFYMPLDSDKSETCPECPEELVVYVRKGGGGERDT